ncbi:hypothetical protein [Nocardia sp. NPDC050406]|uniref:hypothetical protein n=1 Tax=Nocardia sp. NPDC050406 TaxID=3364318 RepID=UPI00379B5F1C
MPPQRRKGTIGGGAARNPLADSAEHTPPVSPLRDAEWHGTHTPHAAVHVRDRHETPDVATTPMARQDTPGMATLNAVALPREDLDVAIFDMPLPAAGEGPLSEHENAQLTVCESSIDTLRKAFWAAGRALQIVRDGRLYRSEYATFDEYVEQRWDMQRSYAHKLIRAWPLAARLHGHAPAINEGQIRELLPVAAEHGDDAAVTVYTTLAAENVKITASTLREAVALLPARFDESEVVERLRAWQRGELARPTAEPQRQPDPFSSVETRLVALSRRVVKESTGDPAAAREFAAKLRTLAEQIEQQIG